LNYLDRFKKNPQISGFLKIPPVEIELFHADRLKDRHDAVNSRLTQFCERA